MDPVSAIGLAGAILQFVEFAGKVVSRLNEFTVDLNQIPKSFRHIKTELPLIVDALKRISAQVDSGELAESTQSALKPVIVECRRSTEQLDELLDKILPATAASSWERRRKAVASLVKESKVEEISEALDKYIRILTFHQVIRTGSESETAAITKSNVFWLVPFDRNANFVGRSDNFEQIDAAFKVKAGTQPKVALFGLGGIG